MYNFFYAKQLLFYIIITFPSQLINLFFLWYMQMEMVLKLVPWGLEQMLLCFHVVRDGMEKGLYLYNILFLIHRLLVNLSYCTFIRGHAYDLFSSTKTIVFHSCLIL